MPQDVVSTLRDWQEKFSPIERQVSVRSAYFAPMDDKWFKAQQKKVGVTADVIADAAGKSRAAVSKILNGHQRMTLDWAQAFADALQVPLATVLEKAGVANPATAQQLAPGFAESDVAPFAFQEAATRRPQAIADILGARPGVDVWTVKGMAMSLGGLLAGDFILVDTHQAERARAGDVVVAQVYGRTDAKTVLRRYEPPVLVAASPDPADARVLVVDGENVVIRGKVVASWRVA